MFNDNFKTVYQQQKVSARPKYVTILDIFLKRTGQICTKGLF